LKDWTPVFAEEQLRRSLAAELQNGLGQDIALAKMKLATLRGSAGSELHGPLTGIEQLVERADRSLRVIAFQISPLSLHDLGLVAALQWLAEDIERLWEVSMPLLESPPPVRAYPPGSWGPNAIHQLIAPHAWRLPFERAWRDTTNATP
jgi:signal transduction histidine kinase